MKSTQAYAKESGFEDTCKEFTDESKYKKGEYYIFAYDYEGKILCHSEKKDLIGKKTFCI